MFNFDHISQYELWIQIFKKKKKVQVSATIRPLEWRLCGKCFSDDWINLFQKFIDLGVCHFCGEEIPSSYHWPFHLGVGGCEIWVLHSFVWRLQELPTHPHGPCRDWESQWCITLCHIPHTQNIRSHLSGHCVTKLLRYVKWRYSPI